jgi:peptidyl-prolyl cis-trans isomerase C
MKKLIALLSALALNAAAAPMPPDTPLVTDGPVTVDIRDLDAYMLRIPEKMRVPVRTSYDRIASIVDSVFVTRATAAKAREAGLDKDPAVQRRMQQLQEAFLADLYTQKLQSQADNVDLTQRARELYAAEPEKFKTPEGVYVQQIVVTLKGRTRDMALERANQALGEAKAGKEEFLQLAARYSDDPDKVRNGGDLGYYAPSHFPPAVAEAIAKLKTKGEIAGPIETADGFYVVRFVNRTPARLVTFDEVRDKLVADERDRLRKELMDQFIAQVRGSKTVVINQKNVESYVVPLDASKLEKEQAGMLEKEHAKK